MLYDPKHDLDEIGKTLYAAADLIEEVGWCQYKYELKGWFKTIGYCMVGAINKVMTGNANRFRDLSVIHRVENYILGENVSGWNDNSGRTKEEVVKLMRDVARGA